MLLEHCLQFLLIRLWNFGAQARCIKGDGRVEIVYFEPGRFSLWPGNENARTKQKQQTNGNRAIWLVIERIQTRMAFGWWNERSRNRYFALTSYCNTIGESNNAFSISGLSLAGKRRVHVLIFSSTVNNEHFTKPFFKVMRKSLWDYFGGRQCTTL